MSSVRSVPADAAIEAIAELVDRADRRIAVSVPEGAVDWFRAPLAAAIDRGVLVCLLVHGEDDDWEEVATIVRHSGTVEPMICTIDEAIGAIGPPGTITDPDATGALTVVEDSRLARVIFGSFLANYWVRARLLFVAEPDPLPVSYETFFAAVVRATQALQERRPLWVTAETYPPETVPARTDRQPTRRSGRLINVRQSLLVPATSTFPVENSLVVESEDRRFRIGGSGAIVEDYVAGTVCLEPTGE